MAQVKSTVQAEVHSDSASINDAVSALSATSGPIPGRPTSTFEVQEASEAAETDADIQYPTGRRLWLTVASVMLACLIYGLDLTIVAAAVPSLTNYFKTIRDIGWYQSVYALVGSALTFFWSRCYTVFPVKKTYLVSILIFEIGALVAATAPTSVVFILGRAISGCGGAGMGTGTFTVLTHSFPNAKRPMWMGIIGVVQTGSMVAAPLIGGALIDAFSWRACFAVNVPIGVFALVMVWYGFNSPVTNPDENLPLKAKLWKLDPLGTIAFVPAITCLLMALQWGGITYGWKDWRIITLLVLFGVLTGVFAYLQYRLQENAMLPPRILKNRSILAGAIFEACCDGSLAVTEYYISIYFQGVRGFTAFKSGYLGVPMIVGLTIAALVAGFGTTLIGYYVPFMLATSILGPIGSGMLTTLNLETDLVKVLALLAFIGAAVGLGIGAPGNAVNTVLSIKDVPIGQGVIGFGARLGSSFFISASATLFQTRLRDEVRQSAPGQNTTVLFDTGLSGIRNVIGRDRLRDVLLGYGEAVSQTLYLPVALMGVSLFAALAMEWRSVKKKQD